MSWSNYFMLMSPNHRTLVSPDIADMLNINNENINKTDRCIDDTHFLHWRYFALLSDFFTPFYPSIWSILCSTFSIWVTCKVHINTTLTFVAHIEENLKTCTKNHRKKQH